MQERRIDRPLGSRVPLGSFLQAVGHAYWSNLSCRAVVLKSQILDSVGLRWGPPGDQCKRFMHHTLKSTAPEGQPLAALERRQWWPGERKLQKVSS